MQNLHLHTIFIILTKAVNSCKSTCTVASASPRPGYDLGFVLRPKRVAGELRQVPGLFLKTMEAMIFGGGSGSGGDGGTSVVEDWLEEFYDKFAERAEGACLNPDTWAPDTEYAGPLTFALRIVLASVFAWAFVRWQLKHADDPPMEPFLADLEAENTSVHCLLFNLISPAAQLCFRIPIPGIPDRPCEFILSINPEYEI